MRTVNGPRGWCALTALTVACAGSQAGCSESGVVTMESQTRPKIAIFEEITRPIRVAVARPVVSREGQCGALSREAAAYWGGHTQMDIKSALADAAAQAGKPIRVVQPTEDIEPLLDHEDARIAGVVGSQGPAERVHPQDWDLLIKSDLRIEVTQERTKQTGVTPDWNYGRVIPRWRQTSTCIDVRTTVVHMTLRVMKPDGTELASATASSAPIRTDTGRPPVIVPGINGKTLGSRDEDVAAALRGIPRQFVKLLLPTHVRQFVKVRSSKNKASREGVKLLLTAGNNPSQVEAAIDLFDAALAKKPSDHRTWHARGVALERLGEYAEAGESYQMALNNRGKHYDEDKPKDRREMLKDPYYQAVTRIEERCGSAGTLVNQRPIPSARDRRPAPPAAEAGETPAP